LWFCLSSCRAGKILISFFIKPTMEKQTRGVKRIFLLCIGWLAVGLGSAGIFLPLLPTTPFLLLAAACFVRSSKRFYDWLLNHRLLGSFVRDYLSGRGFPRRVQIVSILLLWLTIGTSAVFFVKITWVRLLLLFIAIAVTWHIRVVSRGVSGHDQPGNQGVDSGD